jgi:peptidoglycan/LPS O-acetylase OafA/YrhL
MINKRNFGLDIVRSFAISLVLFNHIFSNTFKIDMGIWWYLAYLGVDIFFALSGFLIGTILIRICESNNGTLPLTQTKLFLIRRWFRTVPLYIIMLLINFIFSKYVFKSIDVFNWKYLFWLQNFDTPPPKFFGESWT